MKPLTRASRDLYKASQTAGDLNTLRSKGLTGLLFKLARRRMHRAEIRAAKRLGAW